MVADYSTKIEEHNKSIFFKSWCFSNISVFSEIFNNRVLFSLADQFRMIEWSYNSSIVNDRVKTMVVNAELQQQWAAG